MTISHSEKHDKFADLYRACFNRSLSANESKVFADIIREKCQPSWKEIENALQTMSERAIDNPNATAPTAPMVVREIIMARSGKRVVDGGEDFADAVEAIASESDPDVRWSMICNRGASESLVATIRRRGIEFTVWDVRHPLWDWSIALHGDQEWREMARSLYRRAIEARTSSDAMSARIRQRDAYSARWWAAFRAQVDKRSAENWTPPPAELLKNKHAAGLMESLA